MQGPYLRGAMDARVNDRWSAEEQLRREQKGSNPKMRNLVPRRLTRLQAFLLLVGLTAVVVAVMSIGDMFSQKPNDGGVWLLGYNEVKLVDVVPGGPADTAGLQRGDTILGIANRIVTSPAEAARVLIQQKVGSAVPYLIQRGPDISTFTLVLDTYRTGDFKYVYYCFVGFVFFLVGLYIFLKKPKERVAQLFYVMSLAFMLFLVCSLRRSSYYWVDLFVQNAGALSLFLLPAFFLHFFLIFPQRKSILAGRRYLLFLIYLLPALLHVRFTIQQVFGPKRPFEALDSTFLNWLLMGIYLLVGIGSLVHTYAYSQNPVSKRQIRMLLWGTTVGLVPFLVFGVVCVSVFHNTNYLFFGVVPMVLIPFSFGYSIIRYRLMDIDVIIKRSIVYTVLTGFLLGAYLLLVNGVGGFFHKVTGVDSFIVVFLSLIVIAILFAPARERIQRCIDRIFYREEYNFHQTIEALTDKMNVMSEIHRLLTFLFSETCAIMQVRHGVLLVACAESRHLKVALSKGCLDDSVTSVEFDADDTVSLWRHVPSHPLTAEEISTKREFQTLPSDTKANMAKLKGALWAPLIVKGELVGVLVLGEKLSGDIYSAMDREWLSTLAGRAAVAIQNVRLMESIATAKEKLFHAEKLASLGQLASGMAHEIRNPLSAIKMNLQSLCREVNATPVTNKRFEIALSEVDRLEKLIQGMLTFARPAPLTVARVNVHAVLDTTLNVLREDIAKKNITVRKRFHHCLPPIRGDTDKLTQAFLNLCLNAVQAMNDGGEMELATDITTNNGRTMVTVAISDNGRGIRREHMKDIFNPFFTTRADGTGLGLTNALKFIEQHEGTIEAVSEDGHGTVFSVFLPANGEKEVVG